MKQRTMLAAAVAAALAAPLAAQGQMTFERNQWWDDRWYLTPFVGGVIADSDRRSENGWQTGLAVGKPVHPAFNVELRGFYEELGAETGGPGKYKNWGATLDGQWFFLRERGFGIWNRPQPYAVVGVGGIRDKVPGQDDWSFMFNAGVGVVWAFADWGRLVGDARYRWDDNNGRIATNGNFSDWIFTVGLQIPLGQAPRVMAEAPRAAPVVVPPPAPRPAPPPVVVPPPPPKPQAVTRTFDISADGMFEFDRFQLTDVGRARINEVVQVARGTGFTATSIAITGHTDPLGPEAHNQVLSERRATTVRDYLVAQGISPNIITTRGAGESQLRITEADCRAKGQAKTRQALIACLAPDRRVEAVITGTMQAPQ